jgi:hypothetical protein
METTKNLSIICKYLNLVKKSSEDNFTSCKNIKIFVQIMGEIYVILIDKFLQYFLVR